MRSRARTFGLISRFALWREAILWHREPTGLGRENMIRNFVVAATYAAGLTGGFCRRERRARRRLSDETDHHDRAARAGRLDRRAGAHHGTGYGQAARPAGCR